MQDETQAGTANIIRFPIERRRPPIMRELFESAPDAREIANLAATWNLPPIGDKRSMNDAAAAAAIAKGEWPDNPQQRNAALDGMLRKYVDAAIAACRLADAAWIEAGIARAESEQAAQSYFLRKLLPTLEEQADAAGYKAAWLKLEAFGSCEAAQGVARAVNFAKRNEPWIERTVQEDTDWLYSMQRNVKRG